MQRSLDTLGMGPRELDLFRRILGRPHGILLVTGLGAVGLNQVTRFQLDPRDTRTDADYYELVGDDSGVFGCMTLLGCEDLCPKNLPLAAQIAFLRRRMVMAP